MVGEETAMLILREGQGLGTRWTIDRDNMIIGRGEDCDIVLPSRQVSRNHARIRRSGGRHILEDLGSKNGTFINGPSLSSYSLLTLARRSPCSLRDGPACV
jgi:pSer/pThr/pTyr-binding forkhead associated (FHA) protein